MSHRCFLISFSLLFYVSIFFSCVRFTTGLRTQDGDVGVQRSWRQNGTLSWQLVRFERLSGAPGSAVLLYLDAECLSLIDRRASSVTVSRFGTRYVATSSVDWFHAAASQNIHQFRCYFSHWHYFRVRVIDSSKRQLLTVLCEHIARECMTTTH